MTPVSLTISKIRTMPSQHMMVVKRCIQSPQTACVTYGWCDVSREPNDNVFDPFTLHPWCREYDIIKHKFWSHRTNKFAKPSDYHINDRFGWNARIKDDDIATSIDREIRDLATAMSFRRKEHVYPNQKSSVYERYGASHQRRNDALVTVGPWYASIRTYRNSLYMVNDNDTVIWPSQCAQCSLHGQW